MAQTLTYESALGLYFPEIEWTSQGQNIYSEIIWISGPPLPSEVTLNALISAFNFNGASAIQFVSGVIPAISGTGQIPYGNAAPTISNGFEVWSKEFSPSANPSIIKLEATWTADHNTN